MERGEERDVSVTLHEWLEKLEKQIQRSGREQFKTNALLESTQQQMVQVLDAMRRMDEERGREIQQAREGLRNARLEGRVQFFTRLLPVLDSLDDAIASAGRQMDAFVQGGEDRADKSLPFLLRVRFALALLTGRWTPVELVEGYRERQDAMEHQKQSLCGWLKGLELLRERLLGQFAEESIFPMGQNGERFDPHRHLACETVLAAPGESTGVIVRMLRPGYLQGDTVLRHAEVVVAK